MSSHRIEIPGEEASAMFKVRYSATFEVFRRLNLSLSLALSYNAPLGELTGPESHDSASDIHDNRAFPRSCCYPNSYSLFL